MKTSKINEEWRILEFRDKNEARMLVLDERVSMLRRQIKHSFSDIQAIENGQKVNAFVCAPNGLNRGQFLIKTADGDYRAFEKNQDERIDGILAVNLSDSAETQVYVSGCFSSNSLINANGLKKIRANDFFRGEMLKSYNELSRKSERVPARWNTFSLLTTANRYMPNNNTYADMLYKSGFTVNFAFSSLREMLYFYKIQKQKIYYIDNKTREKKDLYAELA